MDFGKIDEKVRESLNGMDISDDEKKTLYPEILENMMKDIGLGYPTQDTGDGISLGHARITNVENYQYANIWIKNEDGTFTNHLFSMMELRRSNTRATNSPEICFPINTG